MKKSELEQMVKDALDGHEELGKLFHSVRIKEAWHDDVSSAYATVEVEITWNGSFELDDETMETLGPDWEREMEARWITKAKPIEEVWR